MKKLSSVPQILSLFCRYRNVSLMHFFLHARSDIYYKIAILLRFTLEARSKGHRRGRPSRVYIVW